MQNWKIRINNAYFVLKKNILLLQYTTCKAVECYLLKGNLDYL